VVPGVAAAWRRCCGAVRRGAAGPGLADGDGSELLRRLRRAPAGRLPAPDLPVLIMTARDQVASASPAWTWAPTTTSPSRSTWTNWRRACGALRRRAAGRAQPTLAWGELVIDPAARTVQRAGQPVELSAREFAVLLGADGGAPARAVARPDRGQAVQLRTARWTATRSRCTCTTCAASWAKA
jgi:two-component system OmpR family response regulator/two-component system response regulator QseB